MPLPNNNTTFPPVNLQSAYTRYALYDAWYSGDTSRLANIYYTQIYNPFDPSSSFWARRGAKERSTAVHIPIAADISATSSAMLFSETPKCEIPGANEPEAPTDLITIQARLEQIIKEGSVFSRLSNAAEICSALGGVYLKVDWDDELADYPILSVAQPDAAIPEFRHGIMVACTFWKELSNGDASANKTNRPIRDFPAAPRTTKLVNNSDSDTVYRYIEHHDKGYILSALYKGTSDNIGVQVDVTEHPETAHLKGRESLATGIDGLLCRYVPNFLPNRQDRGSYLGQSDYAGSESLMDSLDEVYTSLMRDIRLGQGRIMLPESFLTRDDNGNISFDVDQDAYIAINQIAGDENAKITYNQFEIRAEQHIRSATELIVNIVTNAGYSPQTFGIDINGSAESGTALNIRERKSFITTSKKANYWKPVIEDMLELMMMVDYIHLSSGIKPMRPQVEMQDSVQQDIGQVATSIELMNRAQAVSLRTKVSLLHPDWTNAQIESEVEALQDEAGMSLPDVDVTAV